MVLATFADLLRQAAPGALSKISKTNDLSLLEVQDYLIGAMEESTSADQQEAVLLVAMAISRGSQLSLLKVSLPV